MPPRFVPTLTEIVPGHGALQPAPVADSVAPAVEPTEAMIQRIMERVDLVLERRLREAVSRHVLVQAQTLTPRLREEIELLVRDSVAQMLAQEPGSPQPPSGA